jgi:hypothetical protein
MILTILGVDRECRELSAVDRHSWGQYVYYEVLRTFYSDLYSRVEFLPEVLQAVVFQREAPPKKVDPRSPDYYRVASTAKGVRFLLGLVATDWEIDVTDENAPTILGALRPILFPPPAGPTLDTPERLKAAAEIFDRLEGENNGG